VLFRSHIKVKQARQLLAADLALQLDLPNLAKEICKDLKSTHPQLALVSALRSLAQLQLDTDPTLIWYREMAIADSSFDYYVRTKQATMAGRHTKAVAAASELLKRAPNNPYVRMIISERFEAAGKIDEAIAALRPLMASRSPFSPFAANNIAFLICKHKTDRIEEALSLSEAMIKTKSVPQFFDTLGRSHFLMGSHQKSLKVLRKVSIPLRDDASFHQHIADAYLAVGNRQWAEYHQERAKSLTLEQE